MSEHQSWTTDQDCSFDKDGLWFRYRAGALIVHDGKVLMARNDVDPYYYSIGGGVHHAETAEDAVKREVFEETGAQMLAGESGLSCRTSPPGNQRVVSRTGRPKQEGRPANDLALIG